LEFADQLALAILQWAAADGRAGVGTKSYTERSRVGNPQFWTGATLNQQYMLPFWWKSLPLVIEKAQIPVK
jgi:hypothetical protein